MGNTARIHLNNRHNATYWPGEVISGRLYVDTRCTTHSIENLTLGLYGKGTVLIERSDPNNYKRILRLFQNEHYLRTIKTLSQLTPLPVSDTSSPNVRAYEFHFLLPFSTPPTLTVSSNHKIRYSLEVQDPKACSLCQRVRVLPITVLAYRDVAREPMLQPPVVVERDLVVTGGRSTEHRDVHIKAWLEAGGCARGHKIPLHVEINNDSDVRINYSRLILLRTFTYTSHGITEEVKSPVREFRVLKNGVVAPRTMAAWDPDDSRLLLPHSVLISGPPDCSIMKIDYELQIEVDFDDRYTKTVVMTLPLVVGAAMPADVREQVMRNAQQVQASLTSAIISFMVGSLRNSNSASDHQTLVSQDSSI